MEGILQKLLVADNLVIQQGHSELKAAFKHADAIPNLCTVLGSSVNQEVRLFAATLIRKRLTKAKNWNKLDLTVKDAIKLGILAILVKEQEMSVKRAIGLLIGTIAKHEMDSPTGWLELQEFLGKTIQSDKPASREVGMYVLAQVSEIAPQQLMMYFAQYSAIFTDTLQETSTDTSFYTVKILINFAEFAGSDNVKSFQLLLPQVLELTKLWCSTAEDKACECLDLFDQLVESEVAILMPLVKPVMDACMIIAANKDLGDAIRAKAMEFISTLIKAKKKTVAKLGLVDNLLSILFPIMCEPTDTDFEDNDPEDEESNCPPSAASRVVDNLALHMPPEKVIQPLLVLLEPALNDPSPYVKKAAYVALGVVCEGCAESIRAKYLRQFLECVSQGMQDNTNHIVRNGAFFALGQLADNLQPDISKYGSEIMPLLLSSLSQYCTQLQETGIEPPGKERVFFALESFCENLEKGLIPFVPGLMERIFFLLNPTYSTQLRELALCCIHAIANAVKVEIMSYFPEIMEKIRPYLVVNDNQEVLVLQPYALDTLSALLRVAEESNLTPAMVLECLELAMQLIEVQNDPDIRKACYCLVATISGLMKETGTMAPYLPKIVEAMMEAIESDQGIEPQYKDDDESNCAIDLSDDEEDTNGDIDLEGESDSDVSGFAVENSYMDEKAEACIALREMASNLGTAFCPYIVENIPRLLPTLVYPDDEIRKSGIDAVCQFLMSLSEMGTPEAKAIVSQHLLTLIPKLSDIVHNDADREVVMAALDAYADLLKELRNEAIQHEGHLEIIVNCVKDIMGNKTNCQDSDDADNDSDSGECELDALLIQYAGEIVPQLGKALGPQLFLPYFQGMLPSFINKTSVRYNSGERAFAFGAIAESIGSLGEHAGAFFLPLINQFKAGALEEDEDVRNNAIYGVGELVLHSHEVAYVEYPALLALLSKQINKEASRRVVDNLCGAVAKMIIAGCVHIPLEQVLPVLLEHLPLVEDCEEYESIFQALHMLYQAGHPAIQLCLSPVIAICAHTIGEKDVKKEHQAIAVAILRSASQDFPVDFQNLVNNLNPDRSAKIQQAILMQQ